MKNKTKRKTKRKVNQTTFKVDWVGNSYKTRIKQLKTGKDKTFIVYNQDNKIMEKVKRNDLNLKEAQKKFQSDKTLVKGRQRWNKTYREFSTDKPKNKEYQSVVKLKVYDKKTKKVLIFYGSSQKREYSNKKTAIKEARRNAYARYFGRKSGKSDTSMTPKQIKKTSNSDFQETNLYEQYGTYSNKENWYY